MRGEWNGLQALFLRDCPYAYYIHCFAHRLQLTLVSAAKEVSVICEFFSHLDNIVNCVTSSTKRIAELHIAQRNEINHMLATSECGFGIGVNQIGNLQRAGASRWSSHYDSVKSLISIYAATCKVFEVLSDHSPNGRVKAENLKVSTLVELCQQLTESGRSKVYVMLTRLIHLVLTLPVSTATTERSFSAMKKVKTELRNKMEDDFLADCLTFYIERDLAKDINVDSIIDEFYVIKSRITQLI
ncbi:uncharacterized protein LOC124909557 [Impatiens glandulifera]|uniref:uncharacterized protein LOC124909557 n=1 Tax=Impatiens glandulifera TaxID=253017 RepID=UPI001FB0ED3B|nr:uncharacterized protein LOC124909557 [Impatiens glandulifera]